MASRLPGFDPRLFGSLADGASIYELSYAMAPSMPVYHQHIPYSLALHRRHGDPHPVTRKDGSSFANEIIVTSGHSGTHIDALGHFSRDGCLHGGIKASEVETRDGFRELHAAQIPPIFQSAVVVDVAAAKGVDCLQPAEEMSVADIEKALALTGAKLRAGDAVLMRTGWSKRNGSEAEFLNADEAGPHSPGPTVDCIQYIIKRGVIGWGVETVGTDAGQAGGMAPPFPAHNLMHKANRYGLASLCNLDKLPPTGAIIIAAPLKIVKGTCSPLRVLALVPG